MNRHKLFICQYIILVSYTGAITIISITSYIPQDRLNRILNELIELACLIKLSSLIQALMDETIGLYL